MGLEKLLLVDYYYLIRWIPALLNQKSYLSLYSVYTEKYLDGIDTLELQGRMEIDWN